MSLNNNDVWADLLVNVTKPPQPTIDAGFVCGAVDPEYFNWVMYIISRSAVGAISRWNPAINTDLGYVHPCITMGSDGSLYTSVLGGNYGNNPVGNGGIDWALFGTPPAPPTPIFTKSYSSAPLLMGNGLSYTLAHGMGIVPKVYSFFMKNKTAGTLAGIPAGAEVEINANSSDIGVGWGSGHAHRGDATNIYVKIADNGLANGAMHLINMATGYGYNPDFAQWDLIVRAYA